MACVVSERARLLAVDSSLSREMILDASPNRTANSRQPNVNFSPACAISSKIRGVRESQVSGRGILDYQPSLGLELSRKWIVALEVSKLRQEEGGTLKDTLR